MGIIPKGKKHNKRKKKDSTVCTLACLSLWNLNMTTLFRSKLRTMFSKLRYSKTLVDSTINKFSQEPDKEIHTVPSVDPSVYIVLPFKDQRSADRVRKDISIL